MIARLIVLSGLALAVACSKKDHPSSSPAQEPVHPIPSNEPAASGDHPDKPGLLADAAPAGPSDGAPGATAPEPAVPEPSTPNDPQKPTSPDAAPTNLKVLPKDWSRETLLAYMKKDIGAGLGVQCKFCHEGKDYASDKNPNKEAARKMILMTQTINKQFMGGDQIKCITCHKGKAEPQ